MASDRKKNSAFLHIPRPRAKSSNLAHSKETSRKAYSISRRAILVVIVMAMLAVVLAVLSKYFLTPEYIVKNKIENITKDYYENYYYPQLTALVEMQDPISLAETMERYVTPGFARITLRQILLFDNERYAEAKNILTTYCNENATYIQIFPEAPFEKTDYHVEYHYSCDF